MIRFAAPALALLMTTACATSGAQDGRAPDVSLPTVGGGDTSSANDYQRLAACTLDALMADREAATCAPEDLSLEEAERGVAVITCTRSTTNVFQGTRQRTRYTISFTGLVSGKTDVDIWEHPTAPGIKKYSDRVQPLIDACGG